MAYRDDFGDDSRFRQNLFYLDGFFDLIAYGAKHNPRSITYSDRSAILQILPGR